MFLTNAIDHIRKANEIKKRAKMIESYAMRMRGLFGIDCDAIITYKTIEGIIKTLGGSISKVSIGTPESITKDNKDGSFVLYIQKNPRVAHEIYAAVVQIGLLLLDLKYMSLEWEKAKANDYQPGACADAGEFASAFLMPKQLFMQVAKDSREDGKTYNPTLIAQHFNLPNRYVHHRGRGLELWS